MTHFEETQVKHKKLGPTHQYKCKVKDKGEWFVEKFHPLKLPHYGVAIELKFTPEHALHADERIGFVQMVVRGRKGHSDVTSGKLDEVSSIFNSEKVRDCRPSNIRVPFHETAYWTECDLPAFVDVFAGATSPFYGAKNKAKTLFDTEFTSNGKFADHHSKHAFLRDDPKQKRSKSTYPAVYSYDFSSNGKVHSHIKTKNKGNDSLHVKEKFIENRDDLKIKLEKYVRQKGFTGHFFETAALKIHKSSKDAIYLGSIQWGWRLDKDGKFELIKPKLVSEGEPTKEFFFQVANAWNKDKKTIDIPVS